MTTRSRNPEVGSIVLLPLSSGRFAFARVLQDASIGVFGTTSDSPLGVPPVDSGYRFVVGIYDQDLRTLRVVGYSPFDSESEAWPPPAAVTDMLTGEVQVYQFGRFVPLPENADPNTYEPAAVWHLDDIRKRIEAL